MNIKETILAMDKHLVDNNYLDGEYVQSIEDLLLTIETTTTSYEMCCYLWENYDWATFLVLMGKVSQCTTIRKSEIVSLGIYNGVDPFEENKTKKEQTHMYQ